MDMLRSCYRTEMRLRQGSNETTTVRWFFCEPGAAIAPPSVFHSLNWGFPEKKPPTIGEVWGTPRRWVNGAAPGRYEYRDECESDQWIAHGLPHDAVSPIPPIVDGVPICCRLVAGGERWRGSGHFERVPGGGWWRGWNRIPFPAYRGGGWVAFGGGWYHGGGWVAFGSGDVHVSRGGVESPGSGRVAVGGLSAWGTGIVPVGGGGWFSLP